MSLDRLLRTALHEHLSAWPTGAKKCVTYQVTDFRAADMPVLDVEVGSWTQHEVGNNPVGQRVFERHYDVMCHVVNNVQAEDFAESVNLIVDQVVRAVSRFDAIPGVNLQDMRATSAEYSPIRSEEGLGGALTLVLSAVVLVNEAAPDVSIGKSDAEVTRFPQPTT